jgi:sugar O-acyltransferase (sialic acid O-acetyltransferase NeuD family)
MRNIVVAGASGQAKIVVDVLERTVQYQVIGYVDTYKEAGTWWYGYPILGTEKDLPLLIKKHCITGVMLGVGDNWLRSQMVERIQASVPELDFVSAIHPSSLIARGVVIGKGTLMMAGVVVNSDARIGEFCTLCTRSSLDHDSTMGNFSSLAPNVATGGGVSIANFAAIGLGASIIHGVSIGEHTIVGAGSAVIGSLPGYTVAYGTPARVIRPRIAGEHYL